MIPVTGDRVGPYEILGRLGRGGMGLVFSAWDNRLQRDVAIKLLREEYIRGDSYERFLNEARAASGLNHPNICTIFDIGEQDGDPYLVMELLKGETLRGRILSKPMSPEEILCAGVEIADALTAAHARGIIHRDIKPANIFLVAKPSGGWQTKVLDFGLAKIELPDGLDPRYQMTGPGAAVGTVAYMSPEQARGEPLDARSDLFGLGIVLYEMATGQVPFEGLTSALIFVQLLSHPPEPIRRFNPGFPKDFERIILKLLSKERSERFQSSAELLDALRKIDLKKSGSGSSLFSKPSMSWVRNSVTSSSASKAALPKTPILYDPSSAASARPNDQPPESSKPSGEVLTIRPVRRQPLPPVEFPASAAHWMRPPRLSGISVARVSSGSHAAAGAPIEFPPVAGVSSPRNRAHSSMPDSELEPSSATVEAQKISVMKPVAKPPDRAEPISPRQWLWGLIGVSALGLLLVANPYFRSTFRSSVAHHSETLMLGSIANHSGDKTLDGVVTEALRLDLAQSPQLTVPDMIATAGAAQAAGLAAFDASSLPDYRRAAEAIHATSFLSGEIRNQSGNVVISLQISSAATGAAIFQAEETAESREQISDAIDRLSAQIRISLGESGDTIGRTSVPLARDATSSIEALGAYVAGTEAETAGHPLDAIAAFQRAIAAEPKFAQAWLRLAQIYRSKHADVAAADAATHAQDASVGTSDHTRLLAAASYHLNATGDYPRALGLLNQLAASYPLDISTGAERALLLSAQGEFSEALEAAQNTLARNPYDLEASAQAEYAMLALDRGEAAVHLEAQTEKLGQHHAGARILLGFLDPTGGDAASAQDVPSDRIGAQVYRAQVLDATGQLAAGLVSWRAIATTAKATPSLISAASYALAQAALDRALVNDCVEAATLANDAAALPRGQSALFAVGMAQGLCGDLNGTRNAVLALMAQYPQSFAVKHYYLANLTAIDQIRSDDADTALATLQTAQQYDLLAFAPYLRGLAHSGAKQWPMAIADFQYVLLHRGATALSSAPVYAMAQLGLARAYAASGDKDNSATAYGAFLETWKAADPSNRLVVEAKKHLK